MHPRGTVRTHLQNVDGTFTTHRTAQLLDVVIVLVDVQARVAWVAVVDDSIDFY
jgi:hypothetical protein